MLASQLTTSSQTTFPCRLSNRLTALRTARLGEPAKNVPALSATGFPIGPGPAGLPAAIHVDQRPTHAREHRETDCQRPIRERRAPWPRKVPPAYDHAPSAKRDGGQSIRNEKIDVAQCVAPLNATAKSIHEHDVRRQNVRHRPAALGLAVLSTRWQRESLPSPYSRVSG